MKMILAILALLVVAVACGGDDRAANTTTPTGAVVSDGQETDTTVPTAQQEPTSDRTGDEREIENTAEQTNTAEETPKECQQAIEYQTLVEALPREAAGYQISGEPDGTTLSWADPNNPQSTIRYSTASATLTEDDKTLVISLLDTCYVQYLSEGWSQFVEYDGTEGYMRRTEVEGYPAWQQFDKSTGTYTLNVLVEERVFVTIQGSQGVPEDALSDAANAIDYDRIKAAT